MFFRSERLFLRPGWPEDWSELFGQAETPHAFALEQPDRRHPKLLVTLPCAEGSRLIGAVCLSPGGGDAPAQAELGCWIARRNRGQGYATEATRALLTLARTLGHRRIVASRDTWSAAGARLFARLGFAAPAPGERLTLDLGAADGGDDPLMRAA